MTELVLVPLTAAHKASCTAILVLGEGYQLGSELHLNTGPGKTVSSDALKIMLPAENHVSERAFFQPHCAGPEALAVSVHHDAPHLSAKLV